MVDLVEGKCSRCGKSLVKCEHVGSVTFIGLCPFDGLPCEFVESCDDVVELRLGLVPSFNCSRVVYPFGGKYIGHRLFGEK